MGNAYFAEMISDLWRVGKEEEAKELYENLIKDGILKSDPEKVREFLHKHGYVDVFIFLISFSCY